MLNHWLNLSTSLLTGIFAAPQVPILILVSFDTRKQNHRSYKAIYSIFSRRGAKHYLHHVIQ